ncbi:MAG: SBBP repeat-containing protein [Bacteroidia bacterium]
MYYKFNYTTLNTIFIMLKTLLKYYYLYLLCCFPLYSLADGVNKMPANAQYGFIENKGQIIDQYHKLNKEVLFLFQTGNLQVQLKQNGFSYEVQKLVTKSLTSGQEIIPTVLSNDSFQSDLFVHRVDISFLNANQNATIEASEPFSDFINYYTTSTPEAGIVNVNHYQKVLYKNIYPNIDVEFMVLLKGAQNEGIKYNIIVHPGGNLHDVQLKFDGANNTSVTANGNILIETDYGNIEETIPYTYQFTQANNKETRVSKFKQIHSNIFGIDVKDYNPKQTLVIDPAPWATYYGGSFDDFSFGISIDDSTNIIIIGATLSANNIATVGAFKYTFVGSGNNFDAFVVKFNSSGVRLWGTYYGQANDDKGSSVACDSIGNIFITGITNSSTGMATSGAYQTTVSGNYDAFVAKFNRFGHRIWATYFGGSGTENYGQAGILSGIGGKVAIDKLNNVIISGATNSTMGIATVGSHQTTLGGNNDAFIAKFDSSGLLLWSTYYGGNYDENLHDFRINSNDLTIDSNNNILMTGSTGSTNGISTNGAFQVSKSTGLDTYIVKFNSNGQRLWGTYFGGNHTDFSFGITVDSSNNIYLTGTTRSSNLHTTNAYQTTYFGAPPGSGYGDAFIAKFNSSGFRVWSTYYGDWGIDAGVSIKIIDTTIIVTGYTQSTTGIASNGAHQTISNGGIFEGFLIKFGISGNRIWGTYYGGSSEDCIYGVSTDKLGNIFITGCTSSNTNIATSGSHQFTRNGSYDVFVAAFTSNGFLPVTWLAFNAKLLGNKTVNLNWQTAQEINNKGFYVERSFNGTDFKQFGFVNGNGNTNAISNYYFTDQPPTSKLELPTSNFEHPTWNLEPRTIYYRLKQIDFDGNFEYSNVISVALANHVTEEIKVFPNPNKGSFTVLLPDDFVNILNKTAIHVYDLLGNLVLSSNVSNKSNHIALPDFCKGIYFITVQFDNELYKTKILVE